MNTITLRGLRAHTLYHSFAKHQLLSQFLVTNLHYPRHASSTSPTKQPPPPCKLSSVNGPATTHPAPLTLPTRAPNQSAITHYFGVGKTYLAFYKTGVKNVWRNYKISRELQVRINKEHNSLSSAINAGAITRSDFQLLTRSWHDTKRVPLFALVIMICGEFTPLVVMAISSVVPWTCRIPTQIEADRRKLEDRRSVAFRETAAEVPKNEEADVENLSRTQLRQIDTSLGLSSQLWEWVGGLPRAVLARKIRKRVEYLEMDDGLIRKGGGLREMETEEIRMALVERGIDILGKEPHRLKRDMYSWLHSREEAPIEKLLLSRPSVWPVQTQALAEKS